MIRNVSMQFGRAGTVPKNTPGIRFIQGDTIQDNTTVALSFAPGGIYLLFSSQWTLADGTRQGRQAWLICAPEEEKYGTTAITRESLASGGTARVTYTNNNDSTLSMVQTSSTYAWRYALYRVDGNGNPPAESSIETYTGTYSVTPSVSAQSLGTANKLMTADLEVQEIPTDYGQVTQTGTDLSIS